MFWGKFRVDSEDISSRVHPALSTNTHCCCCFHWFSLRSPRLSQTHWAQQRQPETAASHTQHPTSFWRKKKNYWMINSEVGWSVTGNMEVPDLKTVSSWIDKVMMNLLIWWSWRTTTRNKKNKFSLQNDYDTMGRPFFRDQQSSSRRRAGKREKNLM